MDICLDQISEEQLVSDALHQLVQSIHHRAGFLNIYQSVIDCVEPDIRCGLMEPFFVIYIQMFIFVAEL